MKNPKNFDQLKKILVKTFKKFGKLKLKIISENQKFKKFKKANSKDFVKF